MAEHNAGQLENEVETDQGATESIIQAESQQLQEIEKELKNEFQRKRRNESKIQKSETKGTNEQQIESEIELILDASIKVSRNFKG